MESILLQQFTILRAVVGYLGEQGQFGWWQSSFFAPASKAFLAPVFPRTHVVAQCHGVTRAACGVHDEHIGIGRVYHLFRLPEAIEQGIHHVLHDSSVTDLIAKHTASTETALSFLKEAAKGSSASGVGPTKAGDTNDLRRKDCWRDVAGLYVRALDSSAKVYPFFADRS